MTTYLVFQDMESALTAFAAEGFLPSYIGPVAVQAIGQAFRATGNTIDADGISTPEMEPVPGWHVMLSSPVADLAQYEIQPDYPLPVFAGSDLPPPAPAVPPEVARWQAKLALMHQVDGQGVSLWDRLQQLRESLTDAGQQTMLDAAMNEVMNWRRSSPTVAWAAQQLGLTEQQVDDLFMVAAALEL